MKNMRKVIRSDTVVLCHFRTSLTTWINTDILHQGVMFPPRRRSIPVIMRAITSTSMTRSQGSCSYHEEHDSWYKRRMLRQVLQSQSDHMDQYRHLHQESCYSQEEGAPIHQRRYPVHSVGPWPIREYQYDEVTKFMFQP